MVLEAVVGDVAAEFAAVSDRRAVVHATPHPRIFDLLTHLRQAMIGARHFHRRIGQTDADIIPKELPQDPRRCTRVRGAPGRVFWVRRGGKQRLPRRISRDPTVAGTVSGTNGRDRPPVVIAVLGLPTRDDASAPAILSKANKRAFSTTLKPLCVDSAGRRHCPSRSVVAIQKSRGVGLITGPGRTVLDADRFHLVQVFGKFGAAQCRWTGQLELIRALQQKRRDAAPMRQNRWREGGQA